MGRVRDWASAAWVAGSKKRMRKGWVVVDMVAVVARVGPLSVVFRAPGWMILLPRCVVDETPCLRAAVCPGLLVATGLARRDVLC